ncbi:hypothetical protein REPUB_Repub07fG0055100 [Reevesia pubescens]
MFWHHMTEYASSVNKPWVISDPGCSGSKFKWIRKIHGRVVLQERLDRILWNIEAMRFFPEAKVYNLPRMCSDHNPILFCSEIGQPPSREARPFRFEAAWLLHSDFSNVFKEGWSSRSLCIADSVKAVTTRVKKWKDEVFGNIFHKKRKLLRRIEGIQSSGFYGFSVRLHQLEDELLQEYQQILDQEELLWLQKSRLDWIYNGERNTKFFHLTTLIRRNRNRIGRLKIEGTWCNDSDVLKAHKSRVFVSPNVDTVIARNLSHLSGIPLTNDLGLYLGVPIVHRSVKKETYAPLVDKVLQKLADWKGKVLSMAGRRTLIQTTTTSIPLYTMQSAWLPSSVCQKLDQINSNFLWGGTAESGRNHLVSWSKVCSPKWRGGLGLRRARDNNIVMLAKTG